MIKLTQSIPLMAITLGLNLLPNSLNLNLIAQAQTGSSPEESRPMPPPPQPDFDRAAQILGVSKAQLIEALGLPPNPPDRANGEHPRGCMPPPLDIAGIAQKLNISEAELIEILNLPAHPL
jgi:hypothetical protein